MRLLSVIPWLPAVLFCLHLSAQDTLTLQGCISLALQNNLRIKQAELGVRSAEAGLLQSKLSLLPSLNAEASHNFNYGRSIDPTTNDYIDREIRSGSLSLSSYLTVFGGMKKWSAFRQASYDLSASGEDMEQVRNSTVLLVLEAYLQALLASEQVQTAQGQAELAEAQVSRVRLLLESGKAAAGTLLEAEAQLASAELAVVNAQNQLMMSHLNLALSIGLDPGKSFSLESPPAGGLLVRDTLSAAELYSYAEQNQPSVRSALYKVQSARAGLTLARGSLSPAVSIFGMLRSNYSSALQDISGFQPAGYDTTGFLSTDFTPVVFPSYTVTYEKIPFADQLDQNLSRAFGVSMSVSLFNGWQARNAVTQAKIAGLNAEYAAGLAREQLRKDVQLAWAGAAAAEKKYLAALSNHAAAEKAFRYTETKFAEQMITMLEYNTAKNNLAAAASELLQAKYDYIFRIAVLDFYKGKTF